MACLLTLHCSNSLRSQSTLRAFLLEHFMPAGSDLLSWTPPDFQNEPAFLGNVHNATLATWASDINQLWKVRMRGPSDFVVAH